MAAVGQVISVTRGYLWILAEDGRVLEGKRANSSVDAIIGDFVSYRYAETGGGQQSHGEILVDSRSPRTSLIRRSHANRSKSLAANVDHAFIVTAPPPLFNTNVLDRMLCELRNQDIDCSVLVNKSDLQEDLIGIEEILEYYESIGIDVLRISAASGDGFELIHNQIVDPELKTLAFLGMSGVGKSSSLNRLIPDALAKTNAVSAKTGQGRQTTSQGMGYSFPRANSAPLVLIDLPGVTQFGLCHLNTEEVQFGFADISKAAEGCQFRDCSHKVEPECAVREAFESGEILDSRIEGYRAVIEELATFSSHTK
jgi:ribosome biogenesis GTPase